MFALECAVSIVERITSKDKEARYLISKRPDTGLLAGLWEFPSLELQSLDTKYQDRVDQSTQYLKTKYQLELNQPIRHDLGNVVHLFSHIRKVYHIEWIQYQHDQDTLDMDIDDSVVKWVTLSELKASPIPTGLKKALKVLEKFKVSKKYICWQLKTDAFIRLQRQQL
jgi:A/G-specific adenine glycosylase